MPLDAGSKLGPYEILAPIGAGGMGEVYRALDTRLDRIVAVKVSGAEFSERFEREARAVAALNHPHICTLYDVGSNYLVMEYIDGAPLKGPLPLEQVFKYAAQICDALDAAHRKGIVHRDLKPPNILVTKAGVKLLDFGLAKLSRDRERAVGGATETIALTREHTILGTLQYMSPEQLEARDADARSDIFAFGAVLYEMVTGKRAFAGESQASVTAAIMGCQTASLDPLPRGLDHVVKGCLAKDPGERWQNAADVKREIAWLAEVGSLSGSGPAPARNVWRERLAWILAAVLLVVAVFLGAREQGSRSPGDVARFAIYPPDKTFFSGSSIATVPTAQFALSPDGRSIVFSAAPQGIRSPLWLRPIGEVAPRMLPGTENAQDPFWSPDSRWVAFFADGKLKKIPFDGGPAQVVAESITLPVGGSWGRDDTIVFAHSNAGLYRVPATGGIPTSILKFDSAHQETSFRYPYFLPDGRTFLFSIRGGLTEHRGVYAGSLDGKTKKLLTRSDWSAIYAAPGYFLYLDGETLLGQAFDATRLELSGQPFAVATHVGRTTSGATAISASATGVLSYAGPLLENGQLTWLDRSGNNLGTVGPPGDYIDFRFSPDDKRLAAALSDPRGGASDIWITDLVRGSTDRSAFGGSLHSAPAWSPDGERIAFRSNRNGVTGLYQKSTGGGGKESSLLQPGNLGFFNVVCTDWSPDGRNLLFSAVVESGYALWVLPMTGDGKPFRFSESTSPEMHGNFSPDGKLVTYASNESGRFQVYAQTFPRSDRKWTVSINGGYEPRWRADGRELYYLSAEHALMAVAVGPGPSFGVPKPLFQTRVGAGISALRTHYVPTRDGQRFLVNSLSGEAAPNPIIVVLNWMAGLKK